MRDLFGSTKYIKFGVLETILSSSNAVNDLLELEEQKKLEGDFSFLDYLANLDSYLYGLIKLPSNDTKNLEIWINNYIKYLYIPLIEKDCIYLVKSRLIGELSKVKNKDSEIGDNLKDICLETLDFILATVEYKKEELERKLTSMINDEYIQEFLINYYNIYEDKEFIKTIYYENENLYKMKDKFDFLKN